MSFWKRLLGRKEEAPGEPLQVEVVDLRSEEEKKIAEEGARGIGVEPETDTLMQLCADAYWQ